MEHLTKDELRTIIWMCEKEAARITMESLKNGKKPQENEQRQRIISISKKAYSELTDRNIADGTL